jgi:hypothetical protein
MKTTIFRSIGSVLAGLVTIIVLSNGTDTILESTGIFPPVSEQMKHGFNTPWMNLLALMYRIVFMIIGGFVTAYIAVKHKMLHAMILGAIGTVLGIVGAVFAWDIAPAWFLLMLVFAGFPCVWVGCKIAQARSKK